MQLYSTKNKQTRVGLQQALFEGLPKDNGLYMPLNIPSLPQHFIENLQQYSFQEISIEVCKHLFEGAIPDKDIEAIIGRALQFPAPLVSLNNTTKILELFHGPSLAFKDFGARFMAQLMSYYNQQTDRGDTIILVATSGDTGGAVANGFYNTPGVKVVILYPSKKVSPLQEKQLTTLGKNIYALEVDGTFDDCQAMVKEAFLDGYLNKQLQLSSANSINIGRLIPQSFYYFEAYKQLKNTDSPISFVVPSGNFGNLTAGLLAQEMGLPIQHLIAATNANDIVPDYLAKGEYKPRPSIATISNAMDVGAPSNFYRILDLFEHKETTECSTWNIMKEHIKGYSYSDKATREAIKEVKSNYNYTIDPHGAIGYLAAQDYQKANPETITIILETAHPAKFLEEMEATLGEQIDIPERLAILKDKKKEATFISNNYLSLKEWLLTHLK